MTSAPAAQITICGTLNSQTIAALVELAMAAGAALVVQSRPPAAAPSVEIVDAPPAPRQLRAGHAREAGPTPRKTAASHVPVDEPVRRALQDGPLLVAEFLKRTKLSRYQANVLVKRGVLLATGTTHSRSYGLPGAPAKEAP